MASAYLYRTQVAGTSTQKFTFSTWVRRSGAMSDYEGMLNCYTADANRNGIYFGSDTKLNVYFRTSSSSQIYYETTRRFRDTHGWYHIVVAVDTTQSTAGDRVKIYINGVLETDFGSSTNPGQNTNFSCIGTNGLDLEVGRMQYGSTNTKYLNGSMTHVHFTDGYVYAASNFGETDATTGIWKPKVSPTGITYGNNGFFLKFDNSANMGLDSSGNTNNFTVNGTIIQTKDTPSNVFASLNAIDAAGQTLSNINLTGYNASSRCATSTLGFSKGKYYWECKVVTQNAYTMIVGIMNDSNMGVLANLASNANGWGYVLQSNQDGGKSFHNNSTSSVLQSVSQGDIIQIAVDSDAGKIWFGVNGTYVSSGNPATGANAVFTNVSTDKTLIPAYTAYNGSGGNPSLSFNFGNGFFGTTVVTSAQNPDDGIGIFEYDPPAGYRALCTKSINAQEYS